MIHAWFFMPLPDAIPKQPYPGNKHRAIDSLRELSKSEQAAMAVGLEWIATRQQMNSLLG
jgi:hypothetical protein